MKQTQQRSPGPLESRLLEFYEDSILRPWLEMLGLDDTKTRRLTWLLALHCLIDRFLVAAIGTKLLRCSTAKPSPGFDEMFDEMFKELAQLTIPKRAFFAKQLGLLSSEGVDNIRAVNRVRNNLVHFKSKGGIGEIAEIADENSFENVKQKAIKALKELSRACSQHPPPGLARRTSGRRAKAAADRPWRGGARRSGAARRDGRSAGGARDR